MSTGYRNWDLINQNNTYIAIFDKKEETANSLDQESLRELNHIITDLKSQPNIKALVIKSGKKNGFIFGADIKQFVNIKSTDAALEIVIAGHKVFDHLRSLPFKTICVINGNCLGGGLELALACDYRLILESYKPCIGLPEIKLGIIPGWTGSSELPKLIGLAKALPLMLMGKILTPKAAKKLGIVDAIVPERHFEDCYKYFVDNNIPKYKAGLADRISNKLLARILIGKKALSELKKKVKKEHYPAPYALVNNVVKYGVSNYAKQREIATMGQLIATDTARNLLRVFFLSEKLKKVPENFKFTGKHVHVIGAGTMGADIAAYCALKGLKVTLQDFNTKAIAAGLGRANKLFSKKLKEKFLIQKSLDNLIPDVEGHGIKNADLIIEAIVEKLEIKRDLFAKIEQEAKNDAILATNTSSINIENIAANMQNKERLIGIHYFNPVSLMPLVEVVRGPNSSDEAVGRGLNFVKNISKFPLEVKSSPGFLVNRVLAPYLLEAMLLLEDGVSAEDIDQAMRDFGMPQGPIELSDMVGLDICLSVGEVLASHYGVSVPEILRKKVEDKHLGVKTGQGFYKYNKKQKGAAADKAKISAKKQEITDRLVLRFLNETVICLDEKIVKDQDSLDAGIIFGTGFAPFRGGPINYIKEIGKEELIKKLDNLSQKLGERFKPNKLWSEL